MSAAPILSRSRPATDSEAKVARLYEAHRRVVFAYCLRDLRRREDAEDAVQRTFVYALMSIRRGVAPQFERAWLLKIAANVCSSFRRTATRRGRIETPHDLDALQDMLPAPQPSEATDAQELRAAVESLPESQRRAILLREWHGLSYGEIGERLGLTKPATEMLLFRARRSLAQKLQESRAVSAVNAASLVSWVRTLAAGQAVKTASVTGALALSAGAAPFVAPRVVSFLEHPKAAHSTRTIPSRPSAERTPVVAPAGTRTARKPRQRTAVRAGRGPAPTHRVGAGAPDGVAPVLPTAAAAPEPRSQRQPSPAQVATSQSQTDVASVGDALDAAAPPTAALPSSAASAIPAVPLPPLPLPPLPLPPPKVPAAPAVALPTP